MSSDTPIHIGPAGWSYDDWKGIVYPPDMPRSLHALSFLCRYFDTIEINSSFYRPPNPRHTAAWIEKVDANPAFTFTAKLWERFTHHREAWPDASEITAYREGIQPLHDAGKLGAVLVQFPWSFKRTTPNRQWLARVLDTFSDYPLALEIRHASWNRPEVFEGLAERNVAFCNIDQPLFKDSLGATGHATARVGYIRLHGRNAADWFREDAHRNDRYNYLYDLDELAQWVRKIQKVRKLVDETFVITNNHYEGQAVVNAFELQDQLGQPASESPPQSLIEKYPRMAMPSE
jgi:uncharacterized protein YecE (DUF72 family)